MPRRDVLFLNGRTSYNRRNLSILVIFQQPEKCHDVVHDLEDFSDITEEIIDGNDDDDDVGGHIADDDDDPIISIGFLKSQECCSTKFLFSSRFAILVLTTSSMFV